MVQSRPCWNEQSDEDYELNSLMKTMAKKAGVNNERLRNHSGRKTMIQTLSENDIPPTHIAQL